MRIRGTDLMDVPWFYVGPGDGKGEEHRVILYIEAVDESINCTSSDSSEVTTVAQTHSFFGTLGDFLTLFKRKP